MNSKNIFLDETPEFHRNLVNEKSQRIPDHTHKCQVISQCYHKSMSAPLYNRPPPAVGPQKNHPKGIIDSSNGTYS